MEKYGIHPVKYEVCGEFKERASKLWERLHTPGIYSPECLYQSGSYSWPGDYEGRTMLAWALLGRLLDRKSPYLSEALQKYSRSVNEKGYFGEIYLPDVLDEQQLAGHGWLLRSLAENFINTGEKFFADAAKKILADLVMPLRGRFSSYPVSDSLREQKGEASGSRDRKIGDWQVSTDIGAVFILLDGMLQASEVFDFPLGDLPREMVDTFRKIDLLSVRAQTHATLSFLRAVLRLYRQSGDAGLLAYGERIYRIYRENGMTENFANDNWFMRPEWTEPCAVIDSFIAASMLADVTGKEEYLADAHRIWFSGVECGQRDSGGMGCDSCLHDDSPVLQVRIPEATWCCTMRAGEGFFACANMALARKNDTLYVNLPVPGKYTFVDGLTVEIVSSYPIGAATQVKIVKEGVEKIGNIKIFTVGNGWETPAENALHREDYPLEEKSSLQGGKKIFWRGPVIYGRFTGTDEFIPLNQRWRVKMEELKEKRIEVLFDK